MRLHGADLRATSKFKALRIRLKGQIKPTVSVLLLGGLDGIFNIFLSLTFIMLGIVDDSLVTVYVLKLLVFSSMDANNVSPAALCMPLHGCHS